mmetsp:Transcript_67145/g.143680  ORF Transcript_67145/g.143680 Transcript_67145/m.143680 type:complete len:220 (+) Transcript_67145:1161-1820(+)
MDRDPTPVRFPDFVHRADAKPTTCRDVVDHQNYHYGLQEFHIDSQRLSINGATHVLEGLQEALDLQQAQQAQNASHTCDAHKADVASGTRLFTAQRREPHAPIDACHAQVHAEPCEEVPHCDRLRRHHKLALSPEAHKERSRDIECPENTDCPIHEYSKRSLGWGEDSHRHSDDIIKQRNQAANVPHKAALVAGVAHQGLHMEFAPVVGVAVLSSQRYG